MKKKEKFLLFVVSPEHLTITNYFTLLVDY